MKLAVNYSAATARLLAGSEIAFDYFKCPAWPDVIEKAQAFRPVNVHFPLLVGAGIGDALDGETHAAADWRRIEALLTQTATPLVNVHLVAPPEYYPGISQDSDNPAAAEAVSARLIGDLEPVVRCFGTARVIAENNPPNPKECLRPAYRPEVIRRVIEETGCGLLLDLAHARLAATKLGMDERHYVELLPIGRLHEIHITGVQRIAGRWLERMTEQAVPTEIVAELAEREFDHLPLTDPDWRFFERAISQVRAGAWREPWIVTFEYGGVGQPWEALTDADALRTQIPRLRRLVIGA